MCSKAREISMASYESGYESDFEDLDFLMPNGIIVPLKCERRTSIGSIKDSLWSKAKELPGAHLIRDSSHYVFIGVTKDAIEQEFDDAITFKDLDLVYPVLEVSPPKRDRDLNRLYRIVSDVLGIPIKLLDDESETNKELREHRILLKRVGTLAAEKRLDWSEDKKLMFFFPPILDINQDLPYCTEKLIAKAHNLIKITAWLFQDNKQYSYDVLIKATDPPKVVIEKILRKRHEETCQNESVINRRVSTQCQMYVLKVCGKEEYMLKECCMHAYKYFRECINNEVNPHLQIMEKKELQRKLPENTCIMLQKGDEECEPLRLPADVICSWDLPHSTNYSIKINNLPGHRYENSKLEYYVEAQLFHGRQALSKPVRTLTKGFKQVLEFDVSVQSLPRCARLCFVVCSIEGSQQFKDAKILSRLNVNIFDSDGVLVTGKLSKGVWLVSGVEYSNRYSPALVDGNKDKFSHPLQFEIIHPCDNTENTVVYPKESEIDSRLEMEEEGRRPSLSTNPDRFEKLDRISQYHPLQNLAPAEAEYLWSHREFALEYKPNMLPWLYRCVKWLDRHQVFEFYRLLKLLENGTTNAKDKENTKSKQNKPTRGFQMKQILLSTAIELLGPDFVDTRTRTFAVHCLQRQKTRELLRLYLPQLVQAYRFDNYMTNELGNFLLYHALKDKTLGYHFFWSLRCEMSNSQSKHRFAPLLEAYCLYCGADILDNRENEVKAMKKYQDVSRDIKGEPNPGSHNAILQKWLADLETKQVLENKPASMDECIHMKQLCLTECKLLQSKMRPLWLTWQNGSEVPEEVGSDTVKYIVKCGDDLRQDMLCLQLLKQMDMLWKYTDNDYRLTVYDCLAMEQDIGVIEVVRNAVTVCDIEEDREVNVFMGTVSSTHIHEWLTNICYKEKRDYLETIKRFTMSCAGYCVATYLLGVGDRHSDNIMISKTGKMFHIDFGHFMNHKKSKAGIKREWNPFVLTKEFMFHIDFGHFMNHKKSKAGINRERNPFVLTKEFVRVINRGGSTVQSQQFLDFTYKCFEAFMVIRRNANFFITLLKTMMYCEIPELSDNKDIDYFVKSMCLGKPEHVAAEHFLNELLKSVRGQWTVKVDWMFHRLNRIMKAKSSS